MRTLLGLVLPVLIVFCAPQTFAQTINQPIITQVDLQSFKNGTLNYDQVKIETGNGVKVDQVQPILLKDLTAIQQIQENKSEISQEEKASSLVSGSIKTILDFEGKEPIDLIANYSGQAQFLVPGKTFFSCLGNSGSSKSTSLSCLTQLQSTSLSSSNDHGEIKIQQVDSGRLIHNDVKIKVEGISQ